MYNLGDKIKETEERLLRLQGGSNNDDAEEARNLESLLEGPLGKQEAYWYFRSRVVELKDSEKNTKYFHHKASQRKKRNFIKGLKKMTVFVVSMRTRSGV